MDFQALGLCQADCHRFPLNLFVAVLNTLDNCVRKLKNE